MESLDGVSFDVASRHVSRTILSSVGGFSQPARQNIRSLQDLLATIQRFNLQMFDSRTLRRGTYIGEGVSYRVSRCQHLGTREVYARKDVKLPPRSGDTGAFERQVACVLRDVEVMHGLADRPNVLNIVGYGWDIESGNVIPFLVTELAIEGTLRQFLKHNQLALHEKLLLCKDVAHGLHSLHVVGIAHGDLKLDNVLVRPYVAAGDDPREQERLRYTGMQACISDFGHSLHLYDGEEDATVTQRYGGTLAYNAPEILDKTRTSRADLNFRKCDVWSLGLTCWEILIDGKAYYHSADVEHSILSSQKRSSLPTPPPSNPSGQASSVALLDELINVTPQLAGIACKELSEKTTGVLESQDLSRLQYVFKRCLEPDHERRIADIPLLPLFYRQRTSDAPAARIEVRSGTNWSFELFQVANQIPNEVRRQIASDYEKMANEPGTSLVSAKASFQLGMAYAAGFGLDPNPTQALRWFHHSVSKGFRLAEVYMPVLKAIDPKPFTWHHTCLQNYLDCNRAAIKLLFSCLLPGFGETPDVPEHSMYDPYINKLSQVPDVDTPVGQDETALTVAVKFGHTVATQTLIKRGAHRGVIDSAGCNLLYWLFMFPDDEMSTVASYLLPSTGMILEETNKKVTNSSINIDRHAPIRGALVVDPQLPLVLQGSPLAFAVSTYSKKAVEILLDLGADSLWGLSAPGQFIQSGSPIFTAFRLHMAEILEMILIRLTKTTSRKHILKILDGLQEVPSALKVERSLIHGRYLEYAALQTINVLFQFYGNIGHPLRYWKLLKSAARNGDLELCSAIQVCLEGSDAVALSPWQLDELMGTCTYRACAAGQDAAISRKLLEFAVSIGCNINCYAGTSQTPLFIVADHGESDLLDWMIHQFEVDMMAKDSDGNTLLHRIVLAGLLSTLDVEGLIQKGASAMAYNFKDQVPIDLVRDEQDTTGLKALLDNSTQIKKKTFLQRAVHGKSPNMVKACIQSLEETPGQLGGRRQWFQHDVGEALFLAAEIGTSEIVQILLDASGGIRQNPSSFMDGRFTGAVIHKAAKSGNADVLRYCIQAGHDILEDSVEGPPLTIVTKELAKPLRRSDGLRACCGALLDAGAFTSCADADRCTFLPLLLKARRQTHNEYLDLIQTLLQQGCDPNEGTEKHLLAHLIETRDLELAELLVNHGLSISQASSDGDYPLHLCVKVLSGINIETLQQFVSKLLEAGCNPLTENRHGVTSLELAILEDNGSLTSQFFTHILSHASTLQNPLGSTVDNEQKRLLERPSRSIRRRKSLPNMVVQALPGLRSVPDALEQGWALAVFGKKYSAMSAFLSELDVPTKYLTRRKAIILLYWGMAFQSGRILRKFMGGLNRNGTYEQPDEYLKDVWDSIRPYFATFFQYQLLSIPTMLEFGPPERLHMFSQWTEKTGDFRRYFMHEDPDIPEELIECFFHRFQYMSVIDQYSPWYPASHLVEYNFVETQQEPGMCEAVVDAEAERRKEQHLALFSLLGPIGDEELAYVQQ